MKDERKKKLIELILQRNLTVIETKLATTKNP